MKKKYIFGLGLGATLLGIAGIHALKDSSIAKHDAEVRKAEIEAEAKRQAEANKKRISK